MEAVRHSVTSLLPSLSLTVIEELISKLTTAGCETIDDCQYVTEGDLCPPQKSEANSVSEIAQ